MKNKIPEGMCQCGCNQKTSIVEQTRKSRGLVKGQYRKFIKGHQNRLMRKSMVSDYAKAHGYKSEKELLQALLKKHNNYAEVANEIGITMQWVGMLVRRYGITKGTNRRLSNDQKREKWNEEHGTSFENTREWLAALYEEFGSAVAANKSGAYKSYVQQCAKEQRAIDNEASQRASVDDRPSNLTGPWTNPSKSPCHECKFKTRDKNEPGCSSCELPGDYVRLVECNFYPGVQAPHQAAVYYNARGHAHNYHEWGQR